MRKGAGEYRERVVILTRETASADATGEEVESWPTPQPLGTDEHWARFEGVGGGETTDAPRQSYGTLTLRFRNAVTVTAVDRIRSKEDGRVFAIGSVHRERAPWGGWQTVCVLAGDSTPDTTAPTLTSATIAADGVTLTLVFDEEVTDDASFAGFTLSGTFGAATATYSSGKGSDEIVLTVSREIGLTETVTLDYTPGTVEDWAGNALAAFSGTAVTNNSTHAGAWNPEGVSGVVLWLKGSATDLFTDAPPGTTAAGNGDLVYTWDDRADTFTVQQASATERPVLRLTGSTYDVRSVSDDYLSVSGSTALDNLTAYTVFIAGFADQAPEAVDTLFGFGNNGERGIIRRSFSAGAVWEATFSIGGNNALITSATNIPIGSRFVVGVVVDSSLGAAQAKLYHGGTPTLIGSATQSGAPAASAATKRILTDAFDATRGWPGGIIEVVVLNRAPASAAELAAIADYLTDS
jgi:head-tail adaptor